MNREIETVGWAILQALHDGIEDGPQSWSDLADDQEKRIIRAAIAAIEAVTDLSQYKAQGFSLHRLVAFRVRPAGRSTACEMYGSECRLFGEEEAASKG